MTTDRGLVCLSVATADPRAAAALVNPLAHLVDLAEIRLDTMANPDAGQCMDLISLPLLFTNRPAWEGGNWTGTEQERLTVLIEAVQGGAAWVDLELRADPALRRELCQELASSATRLILSWHDFETTPERQELERIVHAMRDGGADLGKIVTTADSGAQVARVLGLLDLAADMDFPLSCFCMGEPGRISRLASLVMGRGMTYVAASPEQVTAPGQLTARQMDELRRMIGHGH